MKRDIKFFIKYLMLGLTEFMEMDNEHVAVVAGESGTGNSYTTLFRQYDPRLSRWLSVDPASNLFPFSSAYIAFGNNPINYIDPFGLAQTDPNDLEGWGEPDDPMEGRKHVGSVFYWNPNNNRWVEGINGTTKYGDKIDATGVDDDMLEPSKKILKFILSFEKKVNYVYDDGYYPPSKWLVKPRKGNPTIGHGHNIEVDDKELKKYLMINN